jgi:phosphatidyl-myo-inositol dimannoside synthase
MRILFIGLDVYSRVEGIGRFNQRLIRSLADIPNCEICAISLWDTQEHRRSIPSGEIEFVACSNDKLKALAIFLQKLRQREPGIVIYGHILLAPLAAFGHAFRPRTRQILIAHGLEVWGDPRFRKVPLGEAALIRSSIDLVLAVSEFTRQAMMKSYRIPPEKFKILPNAVDPDTAASASMSAGVKKGRHFLSVARLSREDRYKGCDQVIRAMPRILETFPDAVFDLVGEGPLKAELQELTGSLGIEEHVTFWGSIPDDRLKDLYETSRLFVLPSSGEGFGIVFLEAWSHRLPVIAGNRDASAELVENASNGFTIDTDSIEELADAIIRCLAEPELARRMGENGYQTVLKKYTQAHFYERLLGIINEARPCAE